MKVKDVMQRNVTSVAEDETLALALQLMLWNDIRHLPVVRAADGRVTGLISERDLLRARAGQADDDVMERQVRDFMISPVEHIHPNADAADAAADLSTRKHGCLPVIDGGELVGIVTVSDLLATIAQYPTGRSQPQAQPASGDGASVQELMRGEPITVFEDDFLLSAAAKMVAGGVRHMCVVDADGRLIGIVSDRDVRSAVGDPARALSTAEPSERLAALRVVDVMTPQPRSVTADQPLSVVLDALLTDRFGAIPVVGGDDKLVGIVSYIDVLSHLAKRVT
ncbi:MAG: CBS domain-containing protein [Myxococcales bacterium]|nr:CBS domain-containing protein [Myxococcales bacterium]